MNNPHKIISLHGASPLKYGGIFPQKSFSWGTKVFRQKIYGEFIVNGRTNDQIMPGWERSTVNVHLKLIKTWPFYKIMKGFILKVNS